MTNEQAVLQAEAEIAKLKQSYIDRLEPVVINIREHGAEPSLQDLLACQQLGAKYFNFIESFVGNSGLLGAHANGKWVTGFAETCFSVLKAFVVHVNFLRSHADKLAGALEQPDAGAYANMQRMTKEYLPKDQWQRIESLFKENSLPTSGFEYAGANDMKETPKWQLVAGLVVGVVFALIILLCAIFIPNPTSTQFFIFRGMFAISLAAISAIIPGLLHVESSFQKLSIRSAGAIAVFIIVWILNPPALVSS